MFKVIDYQSPDLLQAFLSRRHSFDVEAEQRVRGIIDAVQTEGDAAVRRFTKEFDGVELRRFRVSPKALQTALKAVPKSLFKILEQAAENITRFHEHELEKSFFYDDGDGVVIGQKVTPIERAMCYVPGGKAVYPSSVLMNVIPAKVAGVREIFITSPVGASGQIHPHIAAAAAVVGVDCLYQIGGAQAIAAFAFGTEQVPKVDKITGPGNKYVAIAKRLVFGVVSIDSVAGPSEIAIIADETANPTYLVLDLFSQAEHDEDASAVLITPSRPLADAVQKEAARWLPKMARKHIIQAAIQRHSAIILVKDLAQACDAANQLAPEHLEVQTAQPWELLPHLRHAGAIFLGEHSSEPVGDYFAGPNHTLPTSGTARFFSALSTRDFLKRTSIIHYTKARLMKTGESIAAFADAEALQAHAEAIRIRLRQ
ncbi:MAG: histidinol dehydrogenase [Chloroherpetonaceae bacterium]|nr:histidinol dehydrogenase [Chloroherpetonaceae bacterium]